MESEEMRDLFSGIMDLMVQKRWLKKYTFTEGKGFLLTWTERGAEIASALSTIISACRLTEDDRGPLAFDKAAHGEDLPPGIQLVGQFPDAFTGAWKTAIAELGIDRSEDALLGVVHIIHNWCPDENTGIQFGFGQEPS